jgi:long-subunit fatty acid transport protein
MNRLFLKILLLASFSFLISTIKAQVNDAGLWTGVSIEKKISQAFAVEFAHETRFNENITEAGSFINELGISYRLNKNSQFSCFYRLAYQKQLNNMYVPVNKAYADYTYRIKPGDFVVSLRLRYQVQKKNAFVFDSDGESGSAFRPKLTVKYPIGDFSPYFGAEVYVPVFYSGYKPVDKIRLSTGLEYSFNKMHSIGLGYMIQREYFTTNPLNDFVIQVGYSFSF